MIGSSTSLSDYHHVDTLRSVTLANGSLSRVASSGNKHMSPNLELLSIYMFLVFLLICYPLVKLPKP
jgi:hypothetical protein